MPAKKNQYLVQGSILAASSMIARFIGMLYKVPLTRIIGDEGMGNYTAAHEIYNLALLLSSYSIPLAVSKLVSTSEAKKEYRNTMMIFKTAMLTAFLTGLSASCLVYFGAKTWASITNFEDSSIALKVLAPTILVFALMGVLRGLFQGKNTMMPTAASQIIEQIVHAVVSIAAAYALMREHNASEKVAAYGAAGGTAGTFAGAAAGFLFLLLIFMAYLPYLQKRAKRDVLSHETRRSTVSAFFSALLPILLSQTVYNLSGAIDSAMFGNLMAGRTMDSAAITSLFGVYSNKYRQLTNLPVAVAAALGTAIVPTLARNFSKNDLDGVKKKIYASVKLNMLIAIPAAVLMAVLAEPVILILYTGKENFALSVNLLRLGSASIVFFALSTLTNGVLQGINRMRLPVIHSGISLIVHVVLLYILLRPAGLGVYGLVIGNVSFALLVCVLNWISIACGIQYRQEIRKTFVLPIAAAALMGLTAAYVYPLLLQFVKSVTVAFLGAFAAAAFVYGFSLVVLRAFNQEDMLSLPKGDQIYRLCKKVHLMK